MQHTPSEQALDELEIYVTQLNQAEQTYYIKLELEQGGIFNGRMNLNELPLIPTTTTDEETAKYGLILFNTLLPGRLTNGFHQAWAAAQSRNHILRIRLWFDTDDLKIHAIPWEMIHYDIGGREPIPLALAINDQIAFSRYLSSSDPWGKPISHRPVRLLAAISGPSDVGTGKAWEQLAPVDAQEYRDDLQQRFASLTAYGELACDFLPSGEKQASPEHIYDMLDNGYDVLLYFGHALTHPTLGSRLLLVESESPHRGVLYDGDDLVEWMREAKTLRPRLIILVACNTATVTQKATNERALASLAAQLVQEGGVPAVLAMQRLVDMRVARLFTAYLSEQLMRHGMIDVAVNAARRRIAERDDSAWSTPVLYMRTADGRLFSPNARQEYAKALLGMTAFSRWLGKDSGFIELEVITVPVGKDWSLLMEHPEDAPLAQDGIHALYDAIERYNPAQTLDTTDNMRGALVSPNELHNLASIIGPPHEGQSVMLRCLAAQLADKLYNQKIADRMSPDEGFLHLISGIYISLEGYDHQPASSKRLERLIEAQVRDIEPGLGEELSLLFRDMRGENGYATRHSSYVFLLDGLEKIEDNARLDAAKEILELAEMLPDQQFIVSCSHRVFPALIADRCRVLLLQPINERIVLRYLQKRIPERSHEIFRRIVENHLLELTTDPILLTRIYDRLTEKDVTTLSRTELVLDYLDHALSGIPMPYTQDKAALRTLVTMAWQSRWKHQETLSVDAIFEIMAKVRQQRDYNLETLYQIFHSENLLMSVGQNRIRFVHPLLHAYCSALYLKDIPDWTNRLTDILIMCSVPHLQEWWEDTIYALVGLISDPIPLFELFAHTAHSWKGSHRLLVARSLVALSYDTLRTFPLVLLQKILDACILGLDVQNEESIERRAAIVTTLGRINYPITDSGQTDEQSRRQLLAAIDRNLFQILTLPVRWTSTGPRYEYIRVRIAAARALRTRYAINREHMQKIAHDLWTIQLDEDQNPEHFLSADQLTSLLEMWIANDREQLRGVLRDAARCVPERAIAAFALGDIAYREDDTDVNALLNIITLPEEDPTDDDTIWAATDALTLFDARQVERLLVALFRQKAFFPPRSTEQLAYIAGRVRARSDAVVIWLLKLFLLHPDLTTKAKALQSLAWIGENISSRDWIIKVLRSPEMQDALQSLNFTVDDLPDNLLQWVIVNIVLWDVDAMMQLGFVSEMGPLPDKEARAQQRARLYLRRKAIEAIAWVGDRNIVEQLQDHVHTWHIHLREVWYTTTDLIDSRQKQVSLW